MTNTTLIVGGAGFLGNSLTKRFSELGIPTFVADTKRRIDLYAQQRKNVEYIVHDWQRNDQISSKIQFDNVIHLAWTSNPASSMSNILNDASANIIGTLSLLEQLKTRKLKKFIFMSSGGAVYGNSSENVLIENGEVMPVSAYGVSKLACENYNNLYAQRSGFSPINIRLGNPYGAYQLKGTPVGVMASFIRKIYAGEAIDVYGDGGTIRDYLFIDDFINAISQIIETESIAGTFNLGSGHSASVADIIDIIQRATGRSFDINYLEERRGDARSVILNSHKIQNAIGWRSMTSIENGIRTMIEVKSAQSSMRECCAAT